MNDSMDSSSANTNKNNLKGPNGTATAKVIRSEAYYYARCAWVLAKDQKSLSTFIPIVEQVTAEVDASTLTAEELKLYNTWVAKRANDYPKLKESIETYGRLTREWEARYQKTRDEASLPALKPEFFVDVQLDPGRLNIVKNFDIERAVMILEADLSFFEKSVLKPIQTGHRFCPDSSHWSKTYNAQEEAKALLDSKAPARLVWLPAKLAELTDRNQDGSLIVREGSEGPKDESRMVFKLLQLSAERMEGVETLATKISKKLAEKRAADQLERDVAMANSGNNKRRKTLVDLSDDEEDDDEGGDDDDFAPKAPARETHTTNTRGRKSIPKPSAYLPLSIPDPYPVQYKPTPQPSGRNKTYRGNPPPKKGGGMMSNSDWEEAYRASYYQAFDTKYKKQIVKGELTRDELQRHGFLRWDAVERLRREGKIEEDFVDGKAFW